MRTASDIHEDEVDLPGLGRLHALAAGVDGFGLELLVQRQLFGQRFAQFRVVVDNENLSRVRH
jgi:hypothetical protein